MLMGSWEVQSNRNLECVILYGTNDNEISIDIFIVVFTQNSILPNRRLSSLRTAMTRDNKFSVSIMVANYSDYSRKISGISFENFFFLFIWWRWINNQFQNNKYLEMFFFKFHNESSKCIIFICWCYAWSWVQNYTHPKDFWKAWYYKIHKIQ